MGKICFYCNEEIGEKDLYWSEPIEGTYPSRYGNLFFHKEKCYRQIENIHQYIKDNTERVLEVLANGNPQIPEKSEPKTKTSTKKEDVKKNKKTKTKKAKRKKKHEQI